VVAADHRSVHPNVPGVPWWGAVLIAVTATAIGFAYDAGSADKELSNVFGAMYIIGCVTAVLAVRQAGIFTAVVQPPLILFVSVPGAYWLFHGGQVTALKDILINCGYPLIERFLLMFFTSAVVLVIGLGRWIIRPKSSAAAPDSKAAGLVEALSESITTKVSGLFSGDTGADDEAPRRRHTIERPSTTAASPMDSRATQTTKRPAPSRSRHARPPLTEVIEPVPERPRRPRPVRDAETGAEPRRPRPAPRDTPRRDPYEHRDPYERRAPNDRRSRHDGYEPFEPYEAPRRRPGTNGANGSYGNSTHHPISRVRYRGAADDEDSLAERRTRSRSRSHEADAWEYEG
jgi:hypothetical protein